MTILIPPIHKYNTFGLLPSETLNHKVTVERFHRIKQLASAEMRFYDENSWSIDVYLTKDRCALACKPFGQLEFIFSLRQNEMFTGLTQWDTFWNMFSTKTFLAWEQQKREFNKLVRRYCEQQINTKRIWSNFNKFTEKETFVPWHDQKYFLEESLKEFGFTFSP